MKVLVIFGGVSPEHDVSRASAASVLRNIDREKFSVTAVGITKKGRWLLTDASPEAVEDGSWEDGDVKDVLYSPARDGLGGFYIAGKRYLPDVVFPVLHGENGEDGRLQGMLSLAGIPFVGCGTASAAVCMDKAFTKQVCASAGIPMADWIFVTADEVFESVGLAVERTEKKFSYPVFVKPANTGSSVGVSKAGNRKELVCALGEAAKYDGRILVEEYIDGRELEVAVLGNGKAEASGVGEILPSRDFYSYEAKYVDGTSGLVFDPELPEGKAEELRKTALRVFALLDCRGLSRVDFFLRKSDNAVIFNEINTLPGFTGISMYPKLFAKCGIPYGELITRIIMLAAEERGLRGKNG